jgi:hypothetical protein
MQLYVQVSFWLGLIVTLIRLIEMGVIEWPQERKPKSLGQQVAEMIIGIVIMLWAGWLLWAR